MDGREGTLTRRGAVIALLVALAVAAGCTSPAGQHGTTGTPTPTPTKTASPSQSPIVVRYPGSPYVIVDDVCQRVAYPALIPNVFEAYDRVVATDIDVRASGTRMDCSLLFKRATAGKMGGGSIHLNAWVYLKAADAATDYQSERAQDRASPLINGKWIDLSGLGQRAHEQYVPFKPETNPHIRVQPARRLQLRVLDNNMIILVSVFASLDWNEPFKSSDAQFQQAAQEMVRQTMAALRA